MRMLSKKLLPKKIDLQQYNLNLLLIMTPLPIVTIANSFNDFFVNVGKNLADNIESIIDPLKYIANNVHSINTIEITEDKKNEYYFSYEKFSGWI